MTNPLHLLSERYRCWRHTRGFGIHSPFAYRLVTEALYLRHGYSYYSENDPRLEAPDTYDSSLARALFRLTVFLRKEHKNPLRIFLSSAAPSALNKAITLAGGYLTDSPESADCLILLRKAEFSDYGESNPGETSMETGSLTLKGHRWTIIVKGRPMADTIYLLP